MDAFKAIRDSDTLTFVIKTNELIEMGYNLMEVPHTNRHNGKIEHIAYMIYNGSK